MANPARRTLNKLFLALSFIVVVSFVGAERVESIGTVDQKDAATAIATVCAALLEGCTRTPQNCGLSDTPESTILVDIYEDAVGDIMALNLESFPDDIALAKGMISAALLTGAARQPELQGDLEQIAAMCNEDIDAL